MKNKLAEWLRGYPLLTAYVALVATLTLFIEIFNGGGCGCH